MRPALFPLLCVVLSCASCTTRARGVQTPEPKVEPPHPAARVRYPTGARSLRVWPATDFDQFSRITIGNTPKPWLNVIGNGLFGGNLIELLTNRRDGREYRIDTRRNAVTHTNLKLVVPGDPRETIHGIGYSTLIYGEKGSLQTTVTYFVEPDDSDSEIWLIQQPSTSTIVLQHGTQRSTFAGESVALRVVGTRVQQIASGDAADRLRRTKMRWQEYIAESLRRMAIHGVSHPALMRELIWDVYQVAATVNTDRFSDSGGVIRLRNANMGATYTFNGLDVHGRDGLQMVLAISAFDPELGREILLNYARYMDKTGRIIHRRLLSGQPIDRGHSDESYWFIIATSAYVEHTKDLGILSERVPYLDNEVTSEYVLFKNRDWVRRFDARELPPARFTSRRTSVLEHLRRAIVNVPFGPHGLPRMEDGDWNDALNAMQRGESVMNAGLYAYSLLKLEALYRSLSDAQVNALLPDGSYTEDLRRFDASYRAMKDAVNRHAWDGDWYVRGFDNDGVPFGSRRNDEGKIYLNAQSWAILAGIPDAERTHRILASVNRYLIKNDKATLLDPVYTRKHANIGAITLLPRGSNENGGQWRQCTLWWIAALLEHGRRAAAVRMLDSIVLANADPAVTRTEPYLYNEYIRGPEAVHPGSGGQQAHVQQAALVLHTLSQLYPLVQIVRDFASRYDYPGASAEAKLTSINGQGEVVDWAPKWIEDPPDYEIVRLTSRR